jgi:hypothetical protein
MRGRKKLARCLHRNKRCSIQEKAAPDGVQTFRVRKMNRLYQNKTIEIGGQI